LNVHWSQFPISRAKTRGGGSPTLGLEKMGLQKLGGTLKYGLIGSAQVRVRVAGAIKRELGKWEWKRG